MIPNLFAATQDYWRKLDELEDRYHNGEVSLAEVDAQVAQLMSELAQERRLALRNLGYALQDCLQGRTEIVLGIAFAVLLTYFWLTLNFSF